MPKMRRGGGEAVTPIKWTLIMAGLAIAFTVFSLGFTLGVRSTVGTFKKLLDERDVRIERLVRKNANQEWIHEHLEDSSQ